MASAGARQVVAPLSTIGHWARELGAWSTMRALTLHGSAADRAVLTRYLWAAQEPPTDADADGAADAKGRAKGDKSKRGRGRSSEGGFWFDVVLTTCEPRPVRATRPFHTCCIHTLPRVSPVRPSTCPDPLSHALCARVACRARHMSREG